MEEGLLGLQFSPVIIGMLLFRFGGHFNLLVLIRLVNRHIQFGNLDGEPKCDKLVDGGFDLLYGCVKSVKVKLPKELADDLNLWRIG